MPASNVAAADAFVPTPDQTDRVFQSPFPNTARDLLLIISNWSRASRTISSTMRCTRRTLKIVERSISRCTNSRTSFSSFGVRLRDSSRRNRSSHALASQSSIACTKKVGGSCPGSVSRMQFGRTSGAKSAARSSGSVTLPLAADTPLEMSPLLL